MASDQKEDCFNLFNLNKCLHIWDLKADQDLTSMEGEIWRYLVRSWSAFKSQMWRLQGYLTEKTLKSHLSFIEWTRMRMTTKMLP
ncbi:unnamed protein product [Boreogadus saida]